MTPGPDPQRIRNFLDDGRVHILDGAMGTMLYNSGIFVNVCYDEVNLTDPNVVREVHASYVRAGAEIVETNTFGANPVKLSSFGLEDQTERINHAAVAIAREAAGANAAVAGAVGPLGIRVEPWGPTSLRESEELFGRQIQGLCDAGADGLILETFSDINELLAALRAARHITDRPVMALMSVGADGTTSYGTPADTIAAQLTEAGADAIGLNCSVGPAAMLDTIERMAEATVLPICAQPNAGLPRAVGDRSIYLASPEYMAQYARRIIDAGARFVGGCCGTTPDHIKQIGDYVASVQPRSPSVVVSLSEPARKDLADPVPLATRSALGRKLASGELARCVVMTPPKGWDPSVMIDACRTLKTAGVDAVNVLSTARSHGRMGALPASLVIERDAGLETIAHYTCRDRNMIGMLSDLMGAAAGGLRNLLIETGDPPSMSPYPDATAVFDIDSIGLTNVIGQLNRGVDPGGGKIEPPTEYVVGVRFNHSPIDPQGQLQRFDWKVKAGADFVASRPIFDAREFLDLWKQAASPLPLIATLLPLPSQRSAEYYAHEVPGIPVPDAVIERMRKAQQKGDAAARREGHAIVQEVYEALKDEIRGFQVGTSIRDTNAAREFIARTM